MKNRKCSVTTHLQIVPASLDEYNQLSRFHYRDSKLSPYAAIFAIKDGHPVRSRFAPVVGVIVYTMPAAALELRNIATAGFFSGFGDRRLQLQMVNKHIRCISRVIIEPRYRGLGLASMLVRETIPKIDAEIIEALAVMGAINPFFEKAGMRRYEGKVPLRCVKLIEALGMVGINEDMLIDPAGVQKKLDSLGSDKAGFIEYQIASFLQHYGKRKHMPTGIERTGYVLSKLTSRPVYYILEKSENLKRSCNAETN
jgi:hypothetical protein